MTESTKTLVPVYYKYCLSVWEGERCFVLCNWELGRFLHFWCSEWELHFCCSFWASSAWNIFIEPLRGWFSFKDHKPKSLVNGNHKKPLKRGHCRARQYPGGNYTTNSRHWDNFKRLLVGAGTLTLHKSHDDMSDNPLLSSIVHLSIYVKVTLWSTHWM